MFKIKKRYHFDGDLEFWFPIIGGVILFFATIILCVLGTWGYDGGDSTTTYHHPPIRQSLYIGLPLLWSLVLYIECLFFIEYPSETPIFRKKGFVWDKLPYAIWGMISCVECLAFGISRIVFPFLVLWIVPYFCGIGGYKLITYGCKYGIKAVQIIYVVFTTPDGKAETRIHAIWATQQEKECVKEGDKGESV